MNKVTIESGNRIIAEEMGWKHPTLEFITLGKYPFDKCEDFKFHSSFDWLIKAWAKVWKEADEKLESKECINSCIKDSSLYGVEEYFKSRAFYDAFHKEINNENCYTAFTALCNLILWKRENLK